MRPRMSRASAQGWFAFDLVDRTGRRARSRSRTTWTSTAPWEPLGTTPVRERPTAFGFYRVRITKPGYVADGVSDSGGRATRSS